MHPTRRTFLRWSAAAGALTPLGGAGCGAGSGGATAGPSTAGPGAAGAGTGPDPDPGPDGDSEPDSGGEPARPGTLLILGGTGFLGPHIVDAARERGHAITLFNRGKTNPGLFPGLEKLRGDRDGKLDALRGRTWDAVIDTSGYVPRIVGMSAALLAPAVKHYTFISSISVYTAFPRHGLDETNPLATIDDPAVEDVRANYGALKALSEGAAEQAMPGRVANIRPGLIVGPRDGTDRFTYWPWRVARGGQVLAPGTGDDGVQYIDVRDLAAWVVHMAQGRHAGIYNAVGPAQPLAMRAFLQRCAAATHSDAAFTWVPASFLEAQNVSPWQDMPMWVPPEGDYKGFASVSSARAIAKKLTFRSVEDTVTATLAWLNEQPQDRRTALRAGITPEREATLLAAWERSRG